jgi:ABC-type bacteriocin/lantibiotic exporter with double-glycine peptidase domain
VTAEDPSETIVQKPTAESGFAVEDAPAAPAPETIPVIRLEGVRKSFGDNVVLEGIDLTVTTGEVLVVIGASGSGKSTLLRCINLRGADRQRPDLLRGLRAFPLTRLAAYLERRLV